MEVFIVLIFCLWVVVNNLVLAYVSNKWRKAYALYSDISMRNSEVFAQLGEELEAESALETASDSKKYSWLMGALSISYVLVAAMIFAVFLVAVVV